MKFQDSSFNGLKVTVGTKSVTHARTHPRSKSNMPHQLFQSWGHNKEIMTRISGELVSLLVCILYHSLNAFSTIQTPPPSFKHKHC